MSNRDHGDDDDGGGGDDDVVDVDGGDHDCEGDYYCDDNVVSGDDDW